MQIGKIVITINVTDQLKHRRVGQDWLKTFYEMEMARLMPYLVKLANLLATRGWVDQLGGEGFMELQNKTVGVIKSSFAR